MPGGRDRQRRRAGLTARPSVNRSLRLALLILLAVCLLVFAVQNAAPVRVAFLLWSFSASQAVVIFLVGAAGAALGWFLGAGFRITRKR